MPAALLHRSWPVGCLQIPVHLHNHTHDRMHIFQSFRCHGCQDCKETGGYEKAVCGTGPHPPNRPPTSGVPLLLFNSSESNRAAPAAMAASCCAARMRHTGCHGSAYLQLLLGELLAVLHAALRAITQRQQAIVSSCTLTHVGWRCGLLHSGGAGTPPADFCSRMLADVCSLMQTVPRACVFSPALTTD